VADIPGLIKGAHENRGRGHPFLRHIEHNKVIAYVLDLAATLNGRKGVPPWDLVAELEHYQEGTTRRPSLIVANKIDEEGAEEMYKELKIRVQGVPIFPVCAILQEGEPDLRVDLWNLMDDSDP
jgi:GTPase involved in cell partitioning and DNA repair